MNATASRPTPLATKLRNEWDSAHASRISEYGSFGLISGSEMLSQISATSGESQDAALYELLCLAREGHRAAERLLVQALLPAARHMAHRVRALDDFDGVDRTGVAVAAAWESIRTYRLHLHRRVMGNLTMGMLSIIAPRTSAPSVQTASKTIAVGNKVLDELAGSWEDGRPAPEVQLVNLFTWAIDTAVITRDEVALLSRAALGDESYAEIAADLGINERALNKRVSRIRLHLAAAAQERYAGLC